MQNVIYSEKKDQLHYYVCENREEMGKFAADLAGRYLKALLAVKEEVRVVFASAPSQNEMLHYLTEDSAIDWGRVTGFHMDEYIGLPADSDKMFKVYLQEHLTRKVKLRNFHFMDGTGDPEGEVKRYAGLFNEAPIDLVCLGIGENGHIAFNDPPVADFDDPEDVKIVELDEISRRQQVHDGCFATLDDVPTHAITLTIPALMSAKKMVCTVPGKTKSEAVFKVLNGKIDSSCPATILRTHGNAHLVLDREAYGGSIPDKRGKIVLIKRINI